MLHASFKVKTNIIIIIFFYMLCLSRKHLLVEVMLSIKGNMAVVTNGQSDECCRVGSHTRRRRRPSQKKDK